MKGIYLFTKMVRVDKHLLGLFVSPTDLKPISSDFVSVLSILKQVFRKKYVRTQQLLFVLPKTKRTNQTTSVCFTKNKTLNPLQNDEEKLNSTLK